MNQPENANFDKLPNLDRNTNFQDFVNNKKKELEERISQHPKYSSTSAWVIVFVLILTIIALGTFTLTQIRQSNQEISNLKQKNSVAGSTEEGEVKFPPVSGYAFTIIPNQEIPEGFELNRNMVQSSVFSQRTAVNSSYITEKLNSGRKIISGIEVEVLEYDNQFNQEEFAQEFVKKLGEGFKISSNDIIIPRNFKVSRIDPVDKNIGYIYFTAVTNDNYYIIKYFNQSNDIPEYKGLTKFTESILESLYLN